MTQTATVRKLIGDKAEIEVKRVSACAHNCGECGGGCSELTHTGPVIAIANNPLGARSGDQVLVQSSTRSILGFAAIVYLLPFLLFFLGYALASFADTGEGLAIAVGGICSLFSLFLVVWFDRHIKRKRLDMFSIIEICGR